MQAREASYVPGRRGVLLDLATFLANGAFAVTLGFGISWDIVSEPTERLAPGNFYTYVYEIVLAFRFLVLPWWVAAWDAAAKFFGARSLGCESWRLVIWLPLSCAALIGGGLSRGGSAPRDTSVADLFVIMLPILVLTLRNSLPSRTCVTKQANEESRLDASFVVGLLLAVWVCGTFFYGTVGMMLDLERARREGVSGLLAVGSLVAIVAHDGVLSYLFSRVLKSPSQAKLLTLLTLFSWIGMTIPMVWGLRNDPIRSDYSWYFPITWRAEWLIIGFIGLMVLMTLILWRFLRAQLEKAKGTRR